MKNIAVMGGMAWFIVALVVSPSRGAEPDKVHPLVNSLGMKFVSVRIAGEKPVLFCICKTRVRDFEAFVNDTHYAASKDAWSLGTKAQGTRNVDNWKSPGFAQSELHPVCCVSHKDAVAFCEWLSKKEAKHYRLPTDHEWSCAVGIGDKERAEDGPRGNHRKIPGVFPWGTQWPPPKGAGNYCGQECAGAPLVPKNYKGIDGYRDEFVFTSPVGSFDPNTLGLYDMGGNLWEWCDDIMDPKLDNRQRVLRGGCWGDEVAACLLSSFRRYEVAEERAIIYGFRVVIDENPPKEKKK